MKVVIHIVTLTRNQILAAAAVATIALAVGLTVGFFVWRIRTKGRIVSVGVKVYTDETQTTELTVIDWGKCYPNTDKWVSCYIKNVKTENVTLEILTENFNPVIAGQYLSVSWNITLTTVLQPNEGLAAILNLSISADIENVTDFSFDIIIRATGIE